jgi:hypothetical protein
MSLEVLLLTYLDWLPGDLGTSLVEYFFSGISDFWTNPIAFSVGNRDFGSLEER